MDMPGTGARAGSASASGSRSTDGITTQVVSGDDEHFASAFAGLHIGAMVRQGTGPGPSLVRSTSDGRIHAVSHEVGHPTIAHSALGEDGLLIAFCERIPKGSVIVGQDVAPGDIHFFGPGTDQPTVNAAGSIFNYTALRLDDVYERAEEMGLHLKPVEHGSITRLVPRPGLLVLRRVLADLLALTSGGPTAPPWFLDELLTAAAGGLAEPVPRRIRRPRGSLSSPAIVSRCLHYAQHLDRRPLSHELCRAAGASERTVRRAFVDVYDVPPSVFFRLWALSRAQRRLAGARPSDDTVTEIALDLGFGHLSRFAEQYRDVFGELPSQTLQRQTVDGAPLEMSTTPT